MASPELEVHRDRHHHGHRHAVEARGRVAPLPHRLEGRLIEQWRGQPVWIVRRTPETLAQLKTIEGRLQDPQSEQPQQPAYAQNEYRSIKPDVLVLVGICTHLGCSPMFKPELVAQPFDPEWKGGFFCPCHGSRFDLAGRVFAGVPAPTNLKVPPYKFVDDNHIVIGVDPDKAA